MSDTNTTAAATPVVEKKKRILKPRPLYTVFRITDADGNLIDGAKLEILAHTRAAAEALSAITSNAGAQFKEHVAE